MPDVSFAVNNQLYIGNIAVIMKAAFTEVQKKLI